MVEPAQPPININPKNKINVKLPHASNSALTYPVPVNIEIMLNKIVLKLKSSYFIIRENNNTKNYNFKKRFNLRVIKENFSITAYKFYISEKGKAT